MTANETNISPHRTQDCRGTFCPVPVIEAREAMDALEPRQVLELLATDPGSKSDIPAFARNTGHELIATQDQGHYLVYYLRKAGASRP